MMTLIAIFVLLSTDFVDMYVEGLVVKDDALILNLVFVEVIWILCYGN